MAKENRQLTSDCNGESKGFEGYIQDRTSGWDSAKLYEILVRDKLLQLETFRAENKNDGCKNYMNDGASNIGTEEKRKFFTDPENLKPCFFCSVSRMVRKWRSLERLMSAAVKGFALGAGLEGVLLLLGIFIRLKQRPSSSSRGTKGSKIMRGGIICRALKETPRYSCFFGAFTTMFACVDEVVARVGGHSRFSRLVRGQ